MKNKARSCIVSPEVVGPFKNGGIGTHCYYLAEYLSRKLDHDVTFLYTGKIEVQTEAYWAEWFLRELNIHFVCLPGNSFASLPGLFCNDARIAQRVFNWLRGQTFDVCFFQEMLGHGFRCIQAKRLGVAFQSTALTCMLHSSWEWICQAMQMFPAYGCSELQTKFMERYSSERCDFLISPSQYMFDWAGQNGVHVPEQTAVLPYLFDPAIKAVGYRKPENKIIFFGRLEMRKGLVLLLESLEELDKRGVFAERPVQVTLLGKPGHTPDGGAPATIHRFQQRFSKAIEIKILTDLGHREAMEFLSTHNDALVVCPSLVDNSPFAVIESLQLGFNLIAANTGGIPELFADDGRLFKSDAHSLAAKIEAGLAGRLPPLAKRYSVEESARSWRKFCGEILVAPVNAPVKTSEAKRVRVLLNGDQSADDLDRALECLAKQTHQDFDLTVVSDQSRNGGTSSWERARSKFARPNWSFMELSAASEFGQPGAPRPTSPYTLLLSRGSFVHPLALAKLLAAATAANLDILGCAADVILPGSKNMATPSQLFEPLGSCLEAGVFANVFGCGCVLVRSDLVPQKTAELRQCLDQTMIWPFLAEHVAAGRPCDALPESLFTLRADERTFAQGDRNYKAHFEVLQACTHGLPDWVNRVLLASVASDQNVARLYGRIAQLESETKAANQYNVGTVLFKVNRERRRIKNQIKGLARRLGVGARGSSSNSG